MTHEESIKKTVRICKNAVIDYVKDIHGTQIERSDVLLSIVKIGGEEQVAELLAQVNIFDGMYFRITFDINDAILFVSIYKKDDNFVRKLNEEDIEIITNFIPKE
jgi:hypothetical protein